MSDKGIKVGKYNLDFNDILGLDIEELDIYRPKGLYAHMKKRNHDRCLKYIDKIPEIVENPDYIGVNPNEKGGESLELIKKYKGNVLVGIKLDKNNNHLYVSTMYAVQDSKIERRLFSGRIKRFFVDKMAS
ncbi:MAG: hypothetical protein LUG24_10875 [Clostridiales bacterium]|nr:hypothetical protein [Clostridiales bacterium]